MTLNSRAPNEIQQHEELVQLEAQLQNFAQEFTDAMMFCEEKGDNKGRRYLQGWFRGKKPMRITEVHKKFPEGSMCSTMHLEVMRGGIPASIRYCTKDKGKIQPQIYFEHGDMQAFAQKQFRTPANDTLKKYSGYAEAATRDPGTVNRVRNAPRDSYAIPERLDHAERNVTVLWYYGPTGSGKSFTARRNMQKAVGDNYFVKTGMTKWFDGYSDQVGFIYDDFSRSMLSDVGGMPFLLNLLDRYPVLVKIKRSHRLFKGQFIIITSLKDPVKEFTYHNPYTGQDQVDKKLASLIRRINTVFECNHDWNLNTYTVTDRTSEMRVRVGLPADDANAPPEPPYPNGALAIVDPTIAEDLKAILAPQAQQAPLSFVSTNDAGMNLSAIGQTETVSPTQNSMFTRILAQTPTSQAQQTQNLQNDQHAVQ